MKVEFYKDKKGEYRWRVKAGNGKIIAMSSESYKRKKACVRSFDKLKDFCRTLPVEKKPTGDWVDDYLKPRDRNQFVDL